MVGIIILAGLAAALTVVGLTLLLTSVVFGIAFVVFKTSLPPKTTRAVMGVLCLTGLVFLFVAYRYLSGDHAPKSAGDAAILFYFAGIAAMLSTSVAATFLRLALIVMPNKVLDGRTKAVLVSGAVVLGYVCGFVGMVILERNLAQKFAPPAPITLSYGAGKTHCVLPNQMTFHEGPSTTFSQAFALGRGDRMRLQPAANVETRGWVAFEITDSDQIRVVYGLGRHIRQLQQGRCPGVD
ncbi:hypothetical protein [Ascidiaceihabitans sp.]|uniref:hypothetical protein n=1 Tax=Ascidiaceihabitans sp. TaxID=1872644 RepID=UPI0032993159